jgi:hypothetical protein
VQLPSSGAPTGSSGAGASGVGTSAGGSTGGTAAGSAHKILGGSEDSSQVPLLIKFEALVREPTVGKSPVSQSTPLQEHLEEQTKN